jgi:cobalt-zinc-cadmium efflux system membrane fusion protein
MKYIYIIVITLAIVSCRSNNNAPQKSNKNNKDSLMQVISTTTVKEKPMDDELLLNGNISCDESLMGKVFTPCTGRVNGIHVEVGDHVIRGQILAIVHSTEAAENTQDLTDARAQLHVAIRELQMKKDMQTSGMASDKDVAEARAQVSLLKAQLNRLAIVSGINNYHQGNNAILHSPISGFIISKSIYNDSYVDESSNNTPAFEIADISRVWVIANVYESDIAKVHQGSNVYVTTAAYPDKIFTGRINKIYSMIDEDSKTMKVCINLNNPSGLLKPGMFASVHVSLQKQIHVALCVPVESVIFENGNNYVIVKHGSTYRRQQVTPIHSTDRYIWISSGVKPNDVVVCKNALLMYNALSD